MQQLDPATMKELDESILAAFLSIDLGLVLYTNLWPKCLKLFV